jgi:hypothetical protein
MTGIMAAVAGSTKRINYAAGWYNQGTGAVDLSPISESITSSFTDVSGTYTWVGYLKVASTGAYTTGISTTKSDIYGLGATSTGQFWIGNNAVAPTGAANITTNNSQGTYVVSLTQGLYYPCRFVWSFYLPYSFFQGISTSGFCQFSLNATTAVSGLIFYNTATNGF